MNVAGGTRPESRLEPYSWLFMRISGLVLVVLAIGHLIIMHLINSVEIIDYHWVAMRWITPFWRTYDLVLLWLAMVHGLNGTRIVIDDYVLARGWRMAAQSGLAVVGLIFLALGSVVIFYFQPVGQP
jgi:succinate dehydrogenase / fumarate reductase, membrane anchor subunit